MIRRVFEFQCDNCMRRLQVVIGGTVHNLATAKRHARENGWSIGKRHACDECNPRGDR